MNTYIVILFSLGLFAACLWVAIDSSRIQLKRYKSGISCGPVVLFFSCALLWFVGIPWYFLIRHKIRNGTATLKDEAQYSRGISGAHKVLLGAFCVLLLTCIGCMGYLLFQNTIWKQEAIGKAELLALLQANEMFRRGTYCLYKIDGQCDEEHFSGQHDGPFEIRIAFYQPSLGAAHRIVTEHWVETFNKQMRHLQADPEKYRRHMGLDAQEQKK